MADTAAEVNEADFGTDFITHPSIQSILTNYSSKIILNFDFEHTNSKQVEKFFLEMNTRKSCGHDLIDTSTITERVCICNIGAYAKMIYCSISLGHYPSRWKMGQVTPLFKKYDEFCKKNYRPVTAFPALNNIFERILPKQLKHFYQDILSDFCWEEHDFAWHYLALCLFCKTMSDSCPVILRIKTMRFALCLLLGFRIRRASLSALIVSRHNLFLLLFYKNRCVVILEFVYIFATFFGDHEGTLGTLSTVDEKNNEEEYVCAKSGSRPLFTGKKRAGKCELKLLSMWTWTWT